MLETKNKESNYLCKVVRLQNLRKHSNADRLQCVNIGMNTVITGLDANEGDIYVYFPIESKINRDFLSFTNSFRESTLNKDQTKAGFFEDNCRVKAMRLRGEKSMGYIVPAETVWEFANMLTQPSGDLGESFDTINGILLVEKYVSKSNKSGKLGGSQGKEPKLDRLVDGQVHLHVKTTNLRHVPEAIQPHDMISISYKTHGTSWWVSNVLVKRKLTWLEKLGQKLGLNVQGKEYDLVYGSRRVVKNKAFEDPKGQDHFYGVDVWKEIKEEVGHLIPKGWTLYGEALGFTETGEYIQKGFDYGCDPKGENGKPRMKLEIYRITQTTPDGDVVELSSTQIIEFCEQVGLTPSYRFYYGKAKDVYFKESGFLDYLDEKWNEHFIMCLEEQYNEKDCFMCENAVPEEGIVIRREGLFSYDAYKLKSFRFLEWETKANDKGESNLEEEN